VSGVRNVTGSRFPFQEQLPNGVRVTHLAVKAGNGPGGERVIFDKDGRAYRTGSGSALAHVRAPEHDQRGDVSAE
jgi:hypothetical protein